MILMCMHEIGGKVACKAEAATIYAGNALCIEHWEWRREMERQRTESILKAHAEAFGYEFRP